MKSATKTLLIVSAGAALIAIVLYFKQEQPQSQFENPSTSQQPESSSNAQTQTEPHAPQPQRPSQQQQPQQPQPEQPQPPLPSASSEFKQLAEKTLASLPTNEDLQRLKAEELHSTPAPIVAAARSLSQVTKLLHAHPELAPEGLKFYRECAERASAPDSVRALCFANLRNLSQAAGQPDAFRAAEYPERIRRLGDQIPSGW